MTSICCCAPPPGTGLLATGLVIVLAGLWMTATHVPLVAQATREEVSWGAAAFHTVPGLVVLAFGTLWSAVYWSAAGLADSPDEH